MLTAYDLEGILRIAPQRDKRLFNEFLPIGYNLTTLSSVENKDEVIRLKVVLGTLITLFDDFADLPQKYNPRLLKVLYKIPFEYIDSRNIFFQPYEREVIEFAQGLFSKLELGMKKLENYQILKHFFEFDLKQFFLANQYCELLTISPNLSNRIENRLYLHHNMGIVMAGMIDLMASPSFEINSLGLSRGIFVLGQRAGRISNVISTVSREQNEGDNTNELLSEGDFSLPEQNLLLEEFAQIIEQIRTFTKVKNFSVEAYAEGIVNLHELHTKLTGTI